MRRWLYLLARLLGDLQASRRGRVGQRICNRALWRLNARAMRRVWR